MTEAEIRKKSCFRALLPKSIAAMLFAVFFFNCVAASVSNLSSLPSSLANQKDIFSAVSFVSDSINKVSSSAVKMISTAKQASDPSGETKISFGDSKIAVSQYNSGNFKTDLSQTNLKTMLFYADLENADKDSPPGNTQKNAVFYFLAMLIFCIAARRTFENLFFNSIKNIRKALFAL